MKPRYKLLGVMRTGSRPATLGLEFDSSYGVLVVDSHHSYLRIRPSSLHSCIEGIPLKDGFMAVEVVER